MTYVQVLYIARIETPPTMLLEIEGSFYSIHLIIGMLHCLKVKIRALNFFEGTIFFQIKINI